MPKQKFDGKETKMVHVYFDVDTYNKIKLAATNLSIKENKFYSVSNLVRSAMEEFLKSH